MNQKRIIFEKIFLQAMRKSYYWFLGFAALAMTACGGQKSESETDEDTIDVENIEVFDAFEETSADLSGGSETPDNAIDAEDDTNVKSGKIDTKLSELKDLVNECVDYIAQAKSGNFDVSTATSLIQKAQDIQSELKGYEEEMTSPQLSEFKNLISKLSTEATKLAGISTSNAVDAAKDAAKQKGIEAVESAKDKGKEALKKIGL